jgi:hypothetical protein
MRIARNIMRVVSSVQIFNPGGNRLQFNALDTKAHAGSPGERIEVHGHVLRRLIQPAIRVEGLRVLVESRVVVQEGDSTPNDGLEPGRARYRSNPRNGYQISGLARYRERGVRYVLQLGRVFRQ